MKANSISEYLDHRPCARDYLLAHYSGGFYVSDRAIGDGGGRLDFFWRFVSRKQRPHHVGVLYNDTHWLQLQRTNRYAKPPNADHGWWGCKPTVVNLTLTSETDLSGEYCGGTVTLRDRETGVSTGAAAVEEHKEVSAEPAKNGQDGLGGRPDVALVQATKMKGTQAEALSKTKLVEHHERHEPKILSPRNRQRSNCIVNAVREFPFAFGHFMSDVLPAFLWSLEKLARIIVHVTFRKEESRKEEEKESTTTKEEKDKNDHNIKHNDDHFVVEDIEIEMSPKKSSSGTKSSSATTFTRGGTTTRSESSEDGAEEEEEEIYTFEDILSSEAIRRLVKSNLGVFHLKDELVRDQDNREEKMKKMSFSLLSMCNSFLVPMNPFTMRVYEILRQNIKLQAGLYGETKENAHALKSLLKKRDIFDFHPHVDDRSFHPHEDDHIHLPHGILGKEAQLTPTPDNKELHLEPEQQGAGGAKGATKVEIQLTLDNKEQSTAKEEVAPDNFKHHVAEPLIAKRIVDARVKLIAWHGPMDTFWSRHWLQPAATFCKTIPLSYNPEVMQPHTSQLVRRWMSTFTSRNPFVSPVLAEERAATRGLLHQNRISTGTSVEGGGDSTTTTSVEQVVPTALNASASEVVEHQVPATSEVEHQVVPKPTALNVVLIKREGSYEGMMKKEYAWHFPDRFLKRAWVQEREFLALVASYNRILVPWWNADANRVQRVAQLYSIAASAKQFADVLLRDEGIVWSETGTSAIANLLRLLFEYMFKSRRVEVVKDIFTTTSNATCSSTSTTASVERQRVQLVGEEDRVLVDTTTSCSSTASTSSSSSNIFEFEKLREIVLVRQNFTNTGLREAIDRFAHADVAIYPFGSASSNAAFMRLRNDEGNQVQEGVASTTRGSSSSSSSMRQGAPRSQQLLLHRSRTILGKLQGVKEVETRRWSSPGSTGKSPGTRNRIPGTRNRIRASRIRGRARRPLCIEFLGNDAKMPARGKNEVLSLGLDYRALTSNETYTSRPVYIDPFSVFKEFTDRLFHH
ncbi:unnamed protein product [Amoebophrya sp. A25]|nr:unnamed protein product [Amoebophrya sp. A25]|eukprot:GSA25T00017226001.1